MKAIKLIWLLCIGGMLLPSLSWAAVIEKIQISIAKPLDHDEFEELDSFLGNLKGQPASEKTAMQAEERLLETKRYKQAMCQIAQESLLQCTLVRIPVVMKIEVRGLPQVILQSEFDKRVQIRIGEMLDPDSEEGRKALEHLQNRVSSFLVREGFFGSQVDVSATPVESVAGIHVVINILDGAFMRVQRVVVAGDTPIKVHAVKKAFSGMCFNFRDSFDALMGKGFNCYSKDKEQTTVTALQDKLDELGYISGSVRLTKTYVDPLGHSIKEACRASRQEKALYEEKGILPGARCLNLEVEVIQGPKLVTEIVVEDGQWQDLDKAAQFFRNLFGIEFFSRVFNSSLVGEKYPADETILLNQLNDALTFKSARNVDEATIDSSIQRMQVMLQARGYLSAKVTYKVVQRRSDVIRIRFIINPGNPASVDKITFVGNEAFSDEKLIEDTSLASAIRGGSSSGHLTTYQVQRYAENVKAYYIARGYPQAQVEVQTQVGDNNDINLSFSVQEGEKQQIKAIQFENGIAAFSSDILKSMANCETARDLEASGLSEPYCKSSAYLPDLIDEDERMVEEYYHMHGYPYVTVSHTIIRDQGGYTITFIIFTKNEKGEIVQEPLVQARIGDVLINGNLFTESAPMLREMGLDYVKPGVPYSPAGLEEGIIKLRQSRLFSKATIQYVGMNNFDNTIYPVVNVLERPSLVFDIGAAFSTDTLFTLQFQLTDNNILGSMTGIDTRLNWGFFWGRVSSIRNVYRWPKISGLPLNLEFNVPTATYYDYMQIAVKERHVEIMAGPKFSWDINNFWNLALEYRFRIDFWQENVQQVSYLYNPGLAFKTWDGLTEVLTANPPTWRNVLIPSITYVDVDNPFDPKKGLKLDASVQYSGFLMGGKPPYTVLGGRVVGYISAGPVTFAGQISAKGAFIPDPSANWWVLKYQSDMVALGGDYMVRGYADESIGAKGILINSRGQIQYNNEGQTIPYVHPGNVAAFANLEMRFPIIKYFILGGRLDGAVFSDLAYDGVCTNFFNCTNQLTNYGWSVGIGLRVLLPPGPITIDYGISPITPGTGGLWGRVSRFNILFGYPF